MGFQLVLRLEGNIAFGLAVVVGANEVGFGEVDLQAEVILVIHVFVVVPAQVTRQMVAANVVLKRQFVEEKFLAEVTVRMRQDLGALV